MTAAEMIAVVGCLFLGYWIVAVFVPSLFETDVSADDGAESARAEPDDSSTAEVDREGDPWFEVLEIPEASTREEITAAYKRQIRQYHPDRVAQLGQELRDLAERKSKQINAAYAIALELRSANCHA